MAPGSLYRGEVPRLVVSILTVLLVGGFARFLETVASPLAERYGGILIKIRDADLDPVLQKKVEKARKAKKKVTIDVQVTPQHLKDLEKGVRVLKRGEVKDCSYEEFCAAHDEGIRRSEDVASAVVDGLEFFTKLGNENFDLEPMKYASDSQTSAHASKGVTEETVNVGHPFLDNLRFAFNFAMVFSGITTGMWYVGGRNTIAPMHLEDVLLESLNYLFEGCFKQWIIIPGIWTVVLLDKLRTLGGDSLVSQFLAKMLVIPLATLDSWGIPYYTATQDEGWFVFTTGPHMVSAFPLALPV